MLSASLSLNSGRAWPSGWPWWACAGIILSSLALVLGHTRQDSASFDEPVHLQAAYLEAFQHCVTTDLWHPPLALGVAGLGLRLLRTAPSAVPIEEDAFGHNFLFHNRRSPDDLLAAARAPLLVFLAALLLLVFWTAKPRFGTSSALLALVLLAYEPNFLAHAGIVGDDVAVAFFWLASVLAWEAVTAKASGLRVLGAGAILGCALATKFSAVYLLPTFALVSLAGIFLDLRESPAGPRLREAGRRLWRHALLGAGVLLAAAATLTVVYQPAISGIGEAERAALIRQLAGTDSGGPRAAAFLISLSHGWPAASHYLAGLYSLWRGNAARAGISFLNGRISTGSFPSYFLVVFLTKSTPSFLAGLGVALLLSFRRRKDRWDAVLWLPVLYYFFFSLTSGFNIGVRHLLPVYPFLALAISRLVADDRSPFGRTRPEGRWFPVGLAAAILGAGQLISALGIHPHELSYFNVFAGGPAGGARILSDSNLDWGLDLRRLAARLRELKIAHPTVSYFGGDDVFYRIGVPDFAAAPGIRGRYVAISSTLWDMGPEYFTVYGRPDLARAQAWLISLLRTRGRLIERIGGSTYIYELPQESPPHPRGASEPRPR